MSETGENIEPKSITKEKVVEAFKTVRGKEFIDPENLHTNNDPVLNSAKKTLREWVDEQDKIAKRINTPDALAKAEFDKATILIDAGFRNKSYLASVREWINEDMNNAENEGVSVKIIAEMQKRVDEIDKILDDKPLQQAA